MRINKKLALALFWLGLVGLVSPGQAWQEQKSTAKKRQPGAVKAIKPTVKFQPAFKPFVTAVPDEFVTDVQPKTSIKANLFETSFDDEVWSKGTPEYQACYGKLLLKYGDELRPMVMAKGGLLIVPDGWRTTYSVRCGDQMLNLRFKGQVIRPEEFRQLDASARSQILSALGMTNANATTVDECYSDPEKCLDEINEKTGGFNVTITILTIDECTGELGGILGEIINFFIELFEKDPWDEDPKPDGDDTPPDDGGGEGGDDGGDEGGDDGGNTGSDGSDGGDEGEGGDDSEVEVQA